MFKRTLFLFCLLSAFHTVQAQQISDTKNSSPQNELSIGIAYFPNANVFGNAPSMDMPSGNPAADYHSSKYTLSNKRYAAGAALSFYHHLSAHWGIGVQGGWQHTFRHRNSLITKQREGTFRMHHLSLMASCRYYYSITPIDQFYSGLSVGITDRMVRHYDATSFSHQLRPAVHLTILGAMVGKRLFGFAELGVGALGLARCGAGYRF